VDDGHLERAIIEREKVLSAARARLPELAQIAEARSRRRPSTAPADVSAALRSTLPHRAPSTPAPGEPLVVAAPAQRSDLEPRLCAATDAETTDAVMPSSLGSGSRAVVEPPSVIDEEASAGEDMTTERSHSVYQELLRRAKARADDASF
jgi:hypothetical protein